MLCRRIINTGLAACLVALGFCAGEAIAQSDIRPTALMGPTQTSNLDDYFTAAGLPAPASYSQTSMDTIEDQDGDGINDVLLGVPDGDVVFILSGRNLAFIDSIVGPAGTQFGFCVRNSRSLDGLATEDIIVGVPSGGSMGTGEVRTYINSAAGFVLLSQWQLQSGFQPSVSYGWCVEDAGDVNGDGASDVVVSDPFWNASAGGFGNGVIEVISPLNITGGALAVRVGGGSDNVGRSLLNVGNYNGVGTDEIAFSSNESQPNLPSQSDRVTILNLQQPNFSANIAREPLDDNFLPITDGILGFSIALIQDVDGDGLGELVAGAPDVTSTPGQTRGATCLYNSASFHIFTGLGATGPIAFLEDSRTTGQHFGTTVAALPGSGDLTGDGIPEYLAAKSYASFSGATMPNGRANLFVINGRTNSIAAEARPRNRSFNFGNAVVGVDEVDNRLRFAATDPELGLIHLF